MTPLTAWLRGSFVGAGGAAVSGLDSSCGGDEMAGSGIWHGARSMELGAVSPMRMAIVMAGGEVGSGCDIRAGAHPGPLWPASQLPASA